MESRNRIYDLRDVCNQSLPRWYHWTLHVGMNAFVLLFAFLFVWISVPLVFTLGTFAIFCVSFIAWAVFEYAIHRFVLHGKRFRESRLYREHSVRHHSYFNDRFMTLEKAIDLNRIFLFSVDLAFTLILNACVAWGLSYWIGENAASAVFLSGVLYLFAYEVMHAIAHLHGLSQTRLFARVASHHREHHDPKRMATKNFAVVLPFLDLIFGTRSVANENGGK
jgi:sterol desaturase/sphingolipid hydroxylase (fatty acid hydroxylase superfamily)